MLRRDLDRVVAALLTGQIRFADLDEGTVEAAVRRADGHWVVPLLAEVASHDGTADLAAPVRAMFDRHARHTEAFEVVSRGELRRVFERCAAAGVSPILIKGAALAYTHYPSPRLRPRLDSDLFIHASQRERLASVLLADGFDSELSTSGEHIVHQQQFTRVLGPDIRLGLDVHWKIANPRLFADVLTYDELAAEAVPVPAFGPGARAAGPVHALLIAALHHVAHHEAGIDLLWLYDLHLGMANLDEPAFARFAAKAERHDLASLCARQLAAACEWLETPASPAVKQWITNTASVPLPREIATFTAAGRRPIDVLASDLRVCRSWSTRLALLREHLFPPLAYMAAKYRPATRMLLPWLYAKRIAAGVPRWLFEKSR